MASYLEQPYQDKSILPLKKAAEVTHIMYQITYTLPASKHTENHLLKMDQEQHLMPHGQMASYLEQPYQDKSILPLKKAVEVTMPEASNSNIHGHIHGKLPFVNQHRRC